MSPQQGTQGTLASWKPRVSLMSAEQINHGKNESRCQAQLLQALVPCAPLHLYATDTGAALSCPGWFSLRKAPGQTEPCGDAWLPPDPLTPIIHRRFPLSTSPAPGQSEAHSTGNT